MVQTDETGKTTFRFRHVTGGPVFVVGDFCRWETDQLPMHRAARGEWMLMLRLPPGTYEFRYLAAGRWYTDYAAFGVNRNTLGDFNSVLLVPKVQPIAREPVRVRRAASACLAATT
jgi:1,4-alpha-glucan branching enzyme